MKQGMANTFHEAPHLTPNLTPALAPTLARACALALTLTLGSLCLPAAAQFGALLRPCTTGPCQAEATRVPVAQPWLRHQLQASAFAQRKDWARAAEAARLGLGMVNRALQAAPDLRPQYAHGQLALLKTLGNALLQQGKAEEAIPHLQEALAIEEWEIEQRQATGNPALAALSASETLAALSATINLNQWGAVYLNRRLVTPEMEGGPVDGLLADRLPDLDLTPLRLAQAYVSAGRAAEAYAVHDGPFRRYLSRQENNPNPAARANLDVAMESACLRMAIALAALGQSPQADAAFHCALRLSAKNFVALGLSNTVSTFMEGFAERRRFFLGAYASYALQGQPGRAADAQGQRQLLQLVAETKGVSSRYRERRRAIWAHAQDPAFFQSRQAFLAQERGLTELSVGGNLAMAMALWLNQESALMGLHHEAFARAGLQKVFAPGEETLRRAQAALRRPGPGQGEASALIGYVVYRPVDFRLAQLLPSRVLRYTITEDALDLRDIGPASALARQVRRWRGELIAGQSSAGGPGTGPLASGLSAQLLGDLPQAVRAAGQWVIDPDGVLGLLPFEALALPGTQALVVERHTLRYATSLADFADPFTLAAPGAEGTASAAATGEAVIVGDPVFASPPAPGMATAAGGLRTTSGKRLDELTLSPLPETRGEALRVAAALERMGVASRVHLAEQATAQAFEFSRPPRFLHVATHGLFLEPGVELANGAYVRLASALPGMQSALALSPGAGTGGAAASRFLTGADITRLNLLGTELVVFSACDTGNGEVEAGEGVVSLRRSAEEAGARSTITSLWPVPSASTATLMADFYTRLGEGQGKAEALRQAKLALMRHFPDPVHWAGFLLAGEP